jgi:glycosyltransferase involved in cell wall biosynthesis
MQESSSRPLITTIIPTYRRPKLLRRAIRSVLNQTCSSSRVCVYDNASGDGTASVVAELAKEDSRIAYYCHPANIGSIPNFQYGMKRVGTPFFSFLSDDDLLLPRFYEIALRLFEEYPEAMSAVCATLMVNGRGQLQWKSLEEWRSGLYRPPEALLAMVNTIQPSWTSMMFRREAIDTVGLLDEEVGSACDLDYELRLASRCPIAVSLEPGGIFVQHDESCSAGLTLDSTWPGWKKIIENVVKEKGISPSVRERAKEALTERLTLLLFWRYGLKALSRRNWRDAEKSAAVLARECGARWRSLTLNGMRVICQYAPPCWLVFKLLEAVYRLRRSARNWPGPFGREGAANLLETWGIQDL